MKLRPPVEPSEAERLHRNPRTNRGDCLRLLAHGLAGERQLHRHANEDVRLHESDVRSILARVKR